MTRRPSRQSATIDSGWVRVGDTVVIPSSGLTSTVRRIVTFDGDLKEAAAGQAVNLVLADEIDISRGDMLVVEAGTIALVAFISPFRSDRQMARELLDEGEFLEIFVDTPLDVCRTRDVKGLYAKAFKGEIPNFTGVQSPYEAPEAPELRIDGSTTPPENAADRIVALLEDRDFLLP